ncbi:MAG: hypothetical protein A2289_02460 [Deltaproteobacteria bacterium RIFOXYA12_FULL_58_15]|nr:MAG: hypothetical protein A2289_02460 [Deltaproteobacteria bacterium RIFOXYA12_FULL_58_15]OGR09265.1 MAG: hypothetical protein A2341_24280 [Deltaproteobacteria bacterium RIFOXYB12_FULL_58_9]
MSGPKFQARIGYLTLTTDELAFFRLTCDLFPTFESPLRFLEDSDAQPGDPEVVFESLQKRGLLNASSSGAAQHLMDRLTPVSECNAKVSLAAKGDGTRARNFYLSGDGGVEYRRDGDEHSFGPLRSEAALAANLTQHFQASLSDAPRSLRMSAGDYLVFAVFARDLRGAPGENSGDDTMSLDEVLAYFDEPESKIVRTPSDETWQASVDTLRQQGVLVEREGGYELEPTWHPLAREIVADRQHTITRFDFLDEQWLVREVSIYPTAISAYRLGSEPDGAVVIEELSTVTLADRLAGVVGTLPNLLAAEAITTLKSSRPEG